LQRSHHRDGGVRAIEFTSRTRRSPQKSSLRADARHPDNDQIVPIGASGLMSSKIVKGATLKIYPGAPHGLCSTLKDRVNADLLAFIRT
jgi:hypothetical protein